MNREVKLSLILGFAVVLVVGVLLSDHFSGARQAKLDGVSPERGIAGNITAQAPLTAPDLILVGENGEPQPMPEAKPGNQGAPRGPSLYPAPTLIAGSEAVVPVPEQQTFIQKLRTGLVQNVTTAVDDLASGQTPPANVGLAPEFTFEPEPPQNLIAEREVAAEPAPNASEVQFGMYQIQEGDTLWSIAARKLGDGRRHTEIAELNKGRIASGGTLRVGASIRVPGAKPEKKPAATEPAKRRPSAIAGADEAAKPEVVKDKNGKQLYLVRSGDTLGAIAARLLGSSARYEDILLANPSTLADEESLKPGMKLTIPAR